MGRRAVRAGGGSGVGCSHRQHQPAAAEAAVAAAAEAAVAAAGGGHQACRWLAGLGVNESVALAVEV